MKAKYEVEMADMTKELEVLREKWTKSREEAAKTDEELIMAKALLKQKESELGQAMEVNYLNYLVSFSHLSFKVNIYQFNSDIFTHFEIPADNQT